MRLPLLIAIVIGFLLVTCKGKDYSHELSTIDSLKEVLVSTDSVIATLNTADIAKRTQEIADNSKFIQFNVNKLGDTLDYVTALLLTEYRETGNKYSFYNSEFVRVSNAIDSVNRGLDNLKHDLQSNSLAEGVNPKASIVHETAQVNTIASYVNELSTSLNGVRRSYDTLLPKVNLFVERMSARLATVQEP